MGLKSEQLQNFTYELCYFYVRATVPVGYAPPAYYADRLCKRARRYFSDFLKAQDYSRETGSEMFTSNSQQLLSLREFLDWILSILPDIDIASLRQSVARLTREESKTLGTAGTSLATC